jgi:nucleoside-diphosphate-sugar epimerase
VNLYHTTPLPLRHKTLAQLQSEMPAGIPWQCSHYIHAAPIWLLPEKLDWLKQQGIEHIVAISSQSVVRKAQSCSPYENKLVEKLKASEEALLTYAKQHALQVTILRPTMIYGLELDANVSRLRRLISRFFILPVLGKADGLRQPIHADDLARYVLHVLTDPDARGKIVHVGGRDAMPYHHLLQEIAVDMNKKLYLIHLPSILIYPLEWLSRVRGRIGSMAAVILRMNVDLDSLPDSYAAQIPVRPRPFLKKNTL